MNFRLVSNFHRIFSIKSITTENCVSSGASNFWQFRFSIKLHSVSLLGGRGSDNEKCFSFSTIDCLPYDTQKKNNLGNVDWTSIKTEMKHFNWNGEYIESKSLSKQEAEEDGLSLRENDKKKWTNTYSFIIFHERKYMEWLSTRDERSNEKKKILEIPLQTVLYLIYIHSSVALLLFLQPFGVWIVKMLLFFCKLNHYFRHWEAVSYLIRTEIYGESTVLHSKGIAQMTMVCVFVCACMPKTPLAYLRYYGYHYT